MKRFIRRIVTHARFDGMNPIGYIMKPGFYYEASLVEMMYLFHRLERRYK